MPTFVLHIKADLENIAKLEVPLTHRFCIDVGTLQTCTDCRPAEQAYQPAIMFDWQLISRNAASLGTNVCHKRHHNSSQTVAAAAAATDCCWEQVKESAGSESRERVYVTAAEEHDLSGSKGTANFVMKFAKDSRHECSINIMQLKGVTRAATEDDDGKFVPVMAFECRGIEPTAFHPEDGFVVQTRGGKVFEDVDLSDDWVEFDDKINESVGIYGVEAKFQLHKGK